MVFQTWCILLPVLLPLKNFTERDNCSCSEDFPTIYGLCFFSFSFQYCLLALQFSTLIFFLRKYLFWNHLFVGLCASSLAMTISFLCLEKFIYSTILLRSRLLQWPGIPLFHVLLYSIDLFFPWCHTFSACSLLCVFKKLCTLLVFLSTFCTLSLRQKRLLSFPSIILIRLPLCRFIIHYNVYILKSFTFSN